MKITFVFSFIVNHSPCSVYLGQTASAASFPPTHNAGEKVMCYTGISQSFHPSIHKVYTTAEYLHNSISFINLP